MTKLKASLLKKELDSTDGAVCLNDFKGKYIVLYFYPKDNTSGCTQEAIDFTAALDAFTQQNAVILGVSRDSIKSHNKFIEKQSIPFILISDPEEELCNEFGVMKEKSMYGRKYMGIERSTFLIDPEGKLIKEWRKVKVKGHVDEVLAAVNND